MSTVMMQTAAEQFVSATVALGVQIAVGAVILAGLIYFVGYVWN